MDKLTAFQDLKPFLQSIDRVMFPGIYKLLRKTVAFSLTDGNFWLDFGPFQSDSHHSFILVPPTSITIIKSEPVEWIFNDNSLMHFHSNLYGMLSFYRDISFKFTSESLKTMLSLVANSTPGIRARYLGKQAYRNRSPKKMRRLKYVVKTAGKLWRTSLVSRKPKLEISRRWKVYRDLLT